MGQENLSELQKMVDGWKLDIQLKGKYQELINIIPMLEVTKVEPYAPTDTSSKRFHERLYDWLLQFKEEEQRYMMFLALNLIFITERQFHYLMRILYERQIKKIILEEILETHKSLPSFSYKNALNYYPEELQKTFFIGLSDSSRINDFVHQNPELAQKKSAPSDYVDYNSLVISKVMGMRLEDEINEDYESGELNVENIANAKICSDFFNNVIKNHPQIRNKTRLVIIEDHSLSGTDFITCLKAGLIDSKLFSKIIFAPYIITQKAKQNLENKIKSLNSSNIDALQIKIAFGLLLSEDLKCCDLVEESYLRTHWFDPNVDICEKIQEISEKYYKLIFKKELPSRIKKFGYKNLGICYLNYYNCPNNCLPIVWCDKNWIPLFPRINR